MIINIVTNRRLLHFGTAHSAILGTVAMIMAVKQGDGTIVDQFAKSSGSLSVIGGAGLAIGSFVSGGTATPNFTRFAKNGKQGTIATVVAFFIGNSLMFFFGAISYIFVVQIFNPRTRIAR